MLKRHENKILGFMFNIISVQIAAKVERQEKENQKKTKNKPPKQQYLNFLDVAVDTKGIQKVNFFELRQIIERAR